VAKKWLEGHTEGRDLAMKRHVLYRTQVQLDLCKRIWRRTEKISSKGKCTEIGILGVYSNVQGYWYVRWELFVYHPPNLKKEVEKYTLGK
jgi:hypothetical protein